MCNNTKVPSEMFEQEWGRRGEERRRRKGERSGEGVGKGEEGGREGGKKGREGREGRVGEGRRMKERGQSEQRRDLQ